MSQRRQYIKSTTLTKSRIRSKEALMMSEYSNIMAGLDSLTANLKQNSSGSRKHTKSILLPNKHRAKHSAVRHVVSELVTASLTSKISNQPGPPKSQTYQTPSDNAQLDFSTLSSPYDMSPVKKDPLGSTFDAFDNIPLSTFSYHEIPFEDEDLLPNYSHQLPSSPPPSYPSSEYPFQRPTSTPSISAVPHWKILAQARESMSTKFPPTQVLFTKYVHELLKNRQDSNGSKIKQSSNARWLIKDPHGICWPLKGEKRNRKYQFEHYLPPRLSGARETRSNKNHLRIMALEANMLKAQKISPPLRSRFALPKRDGVFKVNTPSGLQHSISLEDLVWESYLEELDMISSSKPSDSEASTP
ncbi:hypothetical protein K7432_016584 [Basidiobolus ranarum]|uniref:Uncharacterized protein n=1 Tax=Basidiobolus ranarum TaxID=34480 RepID=A0ABR2WEI7_9FUNG